MAHGGALAEAIYRHGGREEDWLDLSTGINPNAVPVGDIPVTAWRRLPDADLLETVRLAAARYYGTGEDHWPLAVPGTQAAIQMLPRLLAPSAAEPRLAVVGPTYSGYSDSFAAAGWAADSVDDLRSIGAEHAVAVVVNPNNPDGRMWSRDDILTLADRRAEQGGMLVVDEAFADLWPEISVADHAARHPALIVLRSFGKFFGLAGLRLGFVIANDDIAERAEAMLGPWAVSGPALEIAARVLHNRRTAATLRSSIEARNEATRAVLDAAGLPIIGDGGLFLLAEHPDARSLHGELCERQILVRWFSYAPTWVRFGLTANADEDRRLAAALAEVRTHAEG